MKQLKTFNLNRFLVSRFLAALGDQFMMFAVPLIILKFTGSIQWPALAFAIQWLPRLIFLPVAGQVADRVNVSKLFILVDGMRVITALLAVLFTFTEPTKVFWILSIAMAFLSLLQSIVFIGMEATVPRQMGPNEMPKAQSLLQSTDQLSQILGPALAGIAVSFFSIKFVLLFGAALFLASLINSFRLPIVSPLKVKKEKLSKLFYSSYTDGFKIILKEKMLIQLMSLTWVFNIVYGSILILTPAIIIQTLQGTDRTYGLVQTIAAFVTIVALILAPKIVRKFGLLTLGGLALFLMPIGAMLSTTKSLVILIIGVAIVMAADALFNVYIRTLRAMIIPKDIFGKVTALIIMINNSSLPIVGVVISFLAISFSHQEILFLMVSITVVLTLIILVVGKNKFKFQTLIPTFNQKEKEEEMD